MLVEYIFNEAIKSLYIIITHTHETRKLSQSLCLLGTIDTGGILLLVTLAKINLGQFLSMHKLTKMLTDMKWNVCSKGC